MKIKIIADEIRYKDGGVISYDRKVDRNIQNRASAIEKKVNDFCSKHNVFNITPTTVVVGNNPPTAVLTYTIVYEDYIEPLPPTRTLSSLLAPDMPQDSKLSSEN